MPNEIPAKQNEPDFLDLRAASTQAYKEGADLATVQISLAALAAVLGPTLVLVDPNWKVWGALFGAAVLLVDAILLGPAAKGKRELGAKIQEVFDTRLFGLPENPLKTDTLPDHETIVALATRYKKAHPDLAYIKNWYPVAAGEVPLEYGRLICQRSNAQWDSALRSTYCWILLGTVLLVPICGLVTGLVLKWNLEQFTLSVVVPVLPAILGLSGEYRKHDDTAKRTLRAKGHLGSLWSRAVNETIAAAELTGEARRVQDELFDRRLRSAAIPSWLYWFVRDDYQLQMEQAATRMAGEIKDKLGADHSV